MNGRYAFLGALLLTFVVLLAAIASTSVQLYLEPHTPNLPTSPWTFAELEAPVVPIDMPACGDRVSDGHWHCYEQRLSLDVDGTGGNGVRSFDHDNIAMDTSFDQIEAFTATCLINSFDSSTTSSTTITDGTWTVDDVRPWK